MSGMCKYSLASNRSLRLLVHFNTGGISHDVVALSYVSVHAASSFNGQVNFDTSSVTTMQSMFRDAASFAGKGLESFDTSKVKTTKQMFFGAASLQRNGMIGWNIQSVEDMDYMVR